MRFGLPQYDPEDYNENPITPAQTGDADRGIGLDPTPAPDLAPDFARHIPSVLLDSDRRLSQADEWATTARTWLADRWAEVHGEDLVRRAADFMTTPIDNPLADVPVAGAFVRRLPPLDPSQPWTEEDYSTLASMAGPSAPIARAPTVAREAAEGAGAGIGRFTRRAAEEIPTGARRIALSTDEEIARLRLDKFPEEVRDTILTAAQDVDWARTQRRGVIPDDVAQSMADDIPKTIDDWIRGGKAGRAYNEEELIAIRNAVGSQGARVDEVTRAFQAARDVGENTDRQLIEMLGETEKLNALVTIAEGGRAEAGRAMRAFQQGARLIDLEPGEAIARIVRKFGSRDKALDAISEYQHMLDDGADIFQQAKFWSKVEKPPAGITDWFKLLRYNSMLSGPRTVEINALGTAVEVPWRLARDFGASALRGHPEEIAPEAAGVFHGLGRGWRPLWQTWRHGITEEQAALGDVPASISARTSGPAAALATGLEIPGRVLRGVDELLYQVAYGMTSGREAAKAATAQGLRGKAWREAVTDFLENMEQHPAAMKRAGGMADRMVFRGDMGTVGRILEPIAAHPVGHVLMPFLKTIYHLTSRGMDRTPVLGPALTGMELLKGTYKGGKTPPPGVPELGERIGDNIMGTALGAYLVHQGLQGNLSAAGPENAERRQGLEATGWQRNSIKIGDHWVSYANWGPFAVPLALAASVAEAGLYAKPDATTQTKAIDAVQRFSKLAQEQSYLAMVGAIQRAIEDPERFGGQVLTNFVQSLVPYGSAINTVAQATEGEGRRQPENFAESMMMRFPGLRNQVGLRQDVLGRPVEEPMAGIEAFMPLRTSQVQMDPVLREMERLQTKGFRASIGQLDEAIDGAKLEPQEQKRLQQIYGAMVQARLGKIINRAGYQKASPGVQAEILEEAEHDLREEARAKLIKEFPDIKRRLREAERAQRDLMRAS